VEREEFFAAALSGSGPSIEKLLGWREVAAGDVVFLPSGTIHAIGPGILLLEVQENSDTTYRIYDWGRPGLDGRPRRLHLEEARHVLPAPAGIACPYARIAESAGPDAPLIDCAPFRLGALRLLEGRAQRGSTGPGGEPGFLVLGGIAGRAAVGAGDGHVGVEVGRGEFVLLPAAVGEFTVRAGPGGFTGLWVREGNTGKIGSHG
jgi:mannose-6-phosphate isomerase